MKKYGIILIGLLLSLLVLTPVGMAEFEQPDLKVNYLYHDFIGHQVPGYPVLICNIENIGTAPVNEPIEVQVTVVRYFMGKLPLFTINTVSKTYTDTLYPENNVDIEFTEGYNSHGLFGSFLFTAEIDPENTIPESDDNNNNYETIFLKILGQWI